ncbi:MAG: phosphatidate cytidylyltransferase [Paludibacter sp.]|nr:phosphatidate cytidylyltransferase [Paludibacter sp.]MDD4198311.1 phosphatidate cytidylyltransferase [Paludibacter sp.]MDD4426925.1 phosphatidate cytidylyltransferase [Paludibacter sp.]
MNNFLKRTLSGFFFVVIIVGSILLSPYIFALAFTIIAAWTVYEFHKLTNRQQEVEIVLSLSVVGSVILFLTSFCYASGIISYPGYSLYGFYVVLVLVVELYRKKNNPVHNWAYFLMGQILIALPFSLLNFILYIDTYHPLLLIAMFATIWINDTGAYLVGITIGKHRLFERISPKKSWEGFIGGAITSLISGYVFSLFVPEVSLISWLFFSQIVVVFGTFGDLLESLLKRTVQVKDSGNVIPGHGGLLDRFDSMLLVAPVIFVYLSFLFK